MGWAISPGSLMPDARSISPRISRRKGEGRHVGRWPALKAARDLGQGWKVTPFVRVQPKETFVMADVKGQGVIQQIWLTPPVTGASPSCASIGTRDRAFSRMSGGRFLRLRLGAIRPDFLAPGLRQPGSAFQLLLGDALPQGLQDHNREHRRKRSPRNGYEYLHRLLPD